MQNLQDGENVAREGGGVAFSFHSQARLELAARWLINYQLVDPINLNHQVFFWVLVKLCLSKAKLLRVTDRELSFVCMHVVRSCFLSHH